MSRVRQAKKRPVAMRDSLESERAFFLDELQAVITLAGGITMDLENKPLGELLDSILPNGISLRVILKNPSWLEKYR